MDDGIDTIDKKTTGDDSPWEELTELPGPRIDDIPQETATTTVPERHSLRLEREELVVAALELERYGADIEGLARSDPETYSQLLDRFSNWQLTRKQEGPTDDYMLNHAAILSLIVPMTKYPPLLKAMMERVEGDKRDQLSQIFDEANDYFYSWDLGEIITGFENATATGFPQIEAARLSIEYMKIGGGWGEWVGKNYKGDINEGIDDAERDRLSELFRKEKIDHLFHIIREIGGAFVDTSNLIGDTQLSSQAVHEVYGMSMDPKEREVRLQRLVSSAAAITEGVSRINKRYVDNPEIVEMLIKNGAAKQGTNRATILNLLFHVDVLDELLQNDAIRSEIEAIAKRSDEKPNSMSRGASKNMYMRNLFNNFDIWHIDHLMDRRWNREQTQTALGDEAFVSRDTLRNSLPLRGYIEYTNVVKKYWPDVNMNFVDDATKPPFRHHEYRFQTPDQLKKVLRFIEGRRDEGLMQYPRINQIKRFFKDDIDSYETQSHYYRLSEEHLKMIFEGDTRELTDWRRQNDENEELSIIADAIELVKQADVDPLELFATASIVLKNKDKDGWPYDSFESIAQAMIIAKKGGHEEFLQQCINTGMPCAAFESLIASRDVAVENGVVDEPFAIYNFAHNNPEITRQNSEEFSIGYLKGGVGLLLKSGRASFQNIETDEQARQVLQNFRDMFERRRNGARVFVNIGDKVLEQILRTARAEAGELPILRDREQAMSEAAIKSAFEVMDPSSDMAWRGGGHGKYMKRRSGVEIALGIRSFGEEGHSTYGSIGFVDNGIPSGATSYGDIVLSYRLDDDLLSRTSFTPEDSFHGALRLTAKDAYALRLAKSAIGRGYDQTSDYVEAQIGDGVSIEQVDEIYVPDELVARRVRELLPESLRNKVVVIPQEGNYNNGIERQAYAAFPGLAITEKREEGLVELDNEARASSTVIEEEMARRGLGRTGLT